MRVFALVGLVAVLAGCATTAKWEHPGLAKDAASSDKAIMASAECEAYASGRTPQPQTMPYMPAPAATSYVTTGTYTDLGGGYGSYRATTTPSGGFASGYAAGANAGANLANAILISQAQEKRDKLAAACMRTLGWIDTSTPEGVAKFKAAVSKLESSTPVDEASHKAMQADYKQRRQQALDGLVQAGFSATEQNLKNFDRITSKLAGDAWDAGVRDKPGDLAGSQQALNQAVELTKQVFNLK